MFKGREGSGSAGGRCAYADQTLTPDKDVQKFEMFYRVWGRKLYDPDADAENWRRAMRPRFGRGASALETALANASRMLALVTSSHLASASNHAYWPEMYFNMPVVLGNEKSPYGDTPTPKCFGTVSALDPQMFSTVVEHAHDLLANWPKAKYSPIEVAQSLEDMATAAEEALRTAHAEGSGVGSAEFRRIEEDVLIQIGLGRFFAKKLRCGVLWEIGQRAGDASVGGLALSHYREAREAWSAMATRAKNVYRADIGYGDVPMRRGHWMDRLAGIDADIAAMQAQLQGATAANLPVQAEAAVREATGRPSRPSLPVVHKATESFVPGTPLDVAVELGKGSGAEDPVTVRLHYRHVDQAERWQWAEMDENGRSYKATIPADYTRSAFPLEYYFELRRERQAWMAPGFNATWSNQPYFAVWKRRSGG
ncbi:MAG TPA: hypothetical protein VGF88_18130 [Acidobacteriaceae bacterium]